MFLSIIIPVLNEAEILPKQFNILSGLQGAEVLFVDGGSTDKTCQLIRESSFKVLSSPPGRARQMNEGAIHSTGEVLLFLHADTLLPAQALSYIQRGLSENDCWGRFDVTIHGCSFLFPFIAVGMNLRSRFTGIATGDQALFIKRSVFNQLGGFPDQPLMEDIELSKRLKRIAKPICLRQTVTTSGRRWESRGVWRTVWLMWRLRWLYWRGVSAEKLAELYR